MFSVRYDFSNRHHTCQEIEFQVIWLTAGVFWVINRVSKSCFWCSPYSPCSPCSPNLLHVLQFGVAGFMEPWPGEGATIHEICNDCCDRRLRKFFPDVVIFSETMQFSLLYFLGNLHIFCVILCIISVNLDRICVQMLKWTVKCKKQLLFIGLIPFEPFYSLLSGRSKCRSIRIFWCHFLA